MQRARNGPWPGSLHLRSPGWQRSPRQRTGCPQSGRGCAPTTPRPGRARGSLPAARVARSRLSGGDRCGRRSGDRAISASRRAEDGRAPRSSVAERGDHHEATVREDPGEEREQVAARRIAPVEVLEDEDEWPVAAQPIGKRDRQLEQAAGGRRADGASPRLAAPAIAAAIVPGSASSIRREESGEPGRDRDELRPTSPRSPRASRGGSSSTKRTRATSRNGPYGRPSPPRSTQPPIRTRAPAADGPGGEFRRPAATCRGPASPPMSTIAGAGLDAGGGRRRARQARGSADEDRAG